MCFDRLRRPGLLFQPIFPGTSPKGHGPDPGLLLWASAVYTAVLLLSFRQLSLISDLCSRDGVSRCNSMRRPVSRKWSPGDHHDLWASVSDVGYGLNVCLCLDTPVGTLDLGVSPAGAETVSCFQTLFYLFLQIKKARDGIRTRDPRLGKAILHHWATRA